MSVFRLICNGGGLGLGHMIVFYYGHILYFLLPYWLYKCLKLKLSNEIVNSMRSVMKRNAKYPYQTFKNDINNSNLYDDISYLYSYNKKNY